MKQIKLTQGQYALVDDEDFERINRFEWQAQYNKYTESFYASRIVSGDTVYMAREIMNAADNVIVDHLNEHTTDNRKQNLITLLYI